MLNFIILWIQLICELCCFNYLNSSIISYLFFRLWIYNLIYSTCLLNCNFMIIICVIIMILSLKFLKIILCLNFHVFRHYFCTYFISIMFVDSHLLLIKICVLIHFFWIILCQSNWETYDFYNCCQYLKNINAS